MSGIAAQPHDDRPTVVRLGARADLSANGAGQAQCQVIEYAVLSDDREVTLTDDRGWGSSGQRQQETIGNVLSSTLTCLLPDNAEETGEQHEWAKFLTALGKFGVSATAEDLRQLPYTVSISTAITLPSSYAI
jgi:hypothetical protein